MCTATQPVVPRPAARGRRVYGPSGGDPRRPGRQIVETSRIG
ncbi:hypothetical protein F750_0474 [Streptomyces sp. PAMC 26508]|nr:hypothetical protein F750_0474 [Streptomyces sp. PAMC 26508]